MGSAVNGGLLRDCTTSPMDRFAALVVGPVTDVSLTSDNMPSR